MRVGCGVFVVAVWVVVFLRCTRGEDSLKSPGDVGMKERGFLGTFSKTVAKILHSDEVLQRSSEKIQTPTIQSCFPSFWNQIRNAAVAIPAWLLDVCSDAYNQITNLRYGTAVLEFTLGFSLSSLLLCAVTYWMGGFDENFYDLVSIRSPYKKRKQIAGRSREDQNATMDDESGSVQEETVDLEYFEQATDGIPEAQIGNSGEGAASAATRQFRPSLVHLHRTAATPDLNQRIGSERDDLMENGEERPTVDDAPRLGLRPFRPPPPTVKVYSLHKPQDIPNDVLGALLCLRKSCSHDHSKIRLIGSKVIVYSGTNTPRSRAKRRSLRHSRDVRSPWMYRESSTIVGEQVLSDEFELQEEVTSVSTQTETTTTPTSVIIRTEAILQDENDESIPYFRGSMTGTLLLAKDSFDTKFVGGNWIDLGESSSRKCLSQCSNVREIIVKSRPDIAELDDHFADLQEKLGNPQANSTIKEERVDDPDTVQSGEFSCPQKEACPKSSMPKSSLESSIDQGSDEEGSSQHWKMSTDKMDFDFNDTQDTMNYTPSPVLRLARSLTYTGSNTEFYERFSLIIADIALNKYSRFMSRSLGELREPRGAPPRLCKTV